MDELITVTAAAPSEHLAAASAGEIDKVIESQRSFQFMLRMVTTSDEIETTVNNLR